jgi:hypothetical protein
VWSAEAKGKKELNDFVNRKSFYSTREEERD